MIHNPSRWAWIRWPSAPQGSVGSPPEPPSQHARVDRARVRGEREFDGASLAIGLIIAGGYGAILYVGILSTWFKWPALAAVLFVLWRNRPRRRRRAAAAPTSGQNPIRE